jgi:hypothetical protein
MAIIAAELVAYQAANHAEDDTATQGGAVVTTHLVEFTDIAANDDLEVISSNAGDTMNMTVVGRSAAGALVSETKALTGTTAAIFATLGIIERVMKATLASAAAGTVTLRRSVAGVTVIALPAGKLATRRLFYDAASEAGSTTRYEKFFFRNENATLTLTTAAIKLTADPATTIRIGGAPSVADSATATNRKTAPASVTFVDDSVSQGVPGGSLAALTSFGVWAEMVRGAAAAAIKSTFTVELSGNTV